MMHKSRHIFSLLCLTAALSCQPEPAALSGRPHFWRPPASGKTLSDWPSGDTTVFVCTVNYPEGYDWVTDSLCLKEGCRIRLFANGILKLELETGTTTGLFPDADLHHLLDGHLLSEGFRDGQTLLLRDGVLQICFPGREKLCGYLILDGNAYSLWRDRDGNGFTLRKNSDVLLRRDDGRPLGDFGDACIGKYGALSLAGGTVSFAFIKNIGEETGGFLSLGGSEILLRKGQGLRFLDIRLLDGKGWTLYCDMQDKTWLSDGGQETDLSLYGWVRWQEAHIGLWEGLPVVVGTAEYGKTRIRLCLWYPLSGDVFSAGQGLCFPMGDWSDYVLGYGDGRRLTLRSGMSLHSPEGGPVLWESEEEVFFVSGNCASLLEKQIFIGVNVRGKGNAYLWAGHKRGEWNLNGYLCAVEALLNPPNRGS